MLPVEQLTYAQSEGPPAAQQLKAVPTSTGRKNATSVTRSSFFLRSCIDSEGYYGGP